MCHSMFFSPPFLIASFRPLFKNEDDALGVAQGFIGYGFN